jgi:hypothetical protein
MPAKKKPAPKKTRRVTKPDWRPKFLDAYARIGVVRAACVVSDISRTMVYRELQNNPEFAESTRAAYEDSTEVLEAELYRRAFLTDTALIFALKSRKPDIYRETIRQEHVGSGGGPIQVMQDIRQQILDNPEALEAAQTLAEMLAIEEPRDVSP